MAQKNRSIQPMECTHVNRIDSLVLSVDDTYEEYKVPFLLNLQRQREEKAVRTVEHDEEKRKAVN